MTYSMFKKAAIGAVLWDAPLIYGGYESYVAYQNKSLTVTSTPSEGVHVTLPDAPKKRKREHPMKGVNKSLLGEFSGSGQASAAMDVDSSELVSQLYSNIAKQIMDIPLALKGPPIHLGSGDKPQKTPRVILDLFPRYYETRDKVNILQAAVSPPGKQAVNTQTFNSRDKVLQLFTRSAWTADQTSANVAATDYSVLPPAMLARLGFPSTTGTETVATQSHNRLGMWYTHTNKIEYFNPSNVCAYITMQVHTSKTSPAQSGGTPSATLPIGQTPVEFYTTYRTDRGNNRFYISTASSENPLLPTLPDNIATTAPVDDYITEVDRHDLTVIGTTVKGREIDRWYKENGKVKFILPPGATFHNLY